MTDKIEVDDASKLVLEVVEKVLDLNEDAPANFYPAWSVNDGTWNPRGGDIYGGEIGFKGHNTDFWSQNTEGSDPNIKQRQFQNVRYAKNIPYIPQIRRKYCSFCKRNGESVAFCSTHSLYENGRVSCPVLRGCVCKICGQKGHTLSHCPSNSTKLSITKLIHRWNNM